VLALLLRQIHRELDQVGDDLFLVPTHLQHFSRAVERVVLRRQRGLNALGTDENEVPAVVNAVRDN
jgi:hypothetical protein